MHEVRFDQAFMFRYSDRGITYAARKLVDDVPGDVKGRRLQEVIDLQEQHTRASHQARVGGRERVLISGLSKRGDRQIGRTPAFYTVLLPLETGAPGTTVEVTITGSTGHSLIAD
jgi:tRNA-2-methylthio-N6-dimethylallyladenosine synthase